MSMEETPTDDIQGDYYDGVQIIIFILIANVIGTNIFIPQHFTLEFAWRIWTWSLFANLVFIVTMSFSLIIPLKLHSENGKIFSNGLICGGMVYVGYMISWFFVCNLSDEWDMEYYPFVFHGYWGAIACMITSMFMMSAKDPESITSNQKNKIRCPSCNTWQRVPKNVSGVYKCTDCDSEFNVLAMGRFSVATELPPIVTSQD